MYWPLKVTDDISKFIIFSSYSIHVFLLQLTDYELCIAANLVDPSSMSTSWEDIGGLEEIIEEIKESVIFPFRRPDLFLNSSLIQPPKGLFFTHVGYIKVNHN